MLFDDIHLLFHNKPEYITFLLKYAQFSHNLMYESEKFVKDATNYLKSQMEAYSKKSPVYQKHIGIISKYELLDKKLWYISDIPSFENYTSGSTSKPFKYKIWNDIYDVIEGQNHYKAITDEFNIHGETKILYLHYDEILPQSDKLISIYRTDNPLISHGLRRNAEIHSAVVNKTFYNNYYKYYEELINYIIENNIDIIHAQSNAIASLTWNTKRLRINNKLCKLISNTGSKLNINNVIELQNNGNIGAWCDHMRCWDGGATFFTCEYNTYHLMDGLAWAYADNYKLISTDYFSLCSPFVNYWNGDYADISNNYEYCKCGRIFRRFEMGRTRSKTTAISDLSTVQTALVENGLLDGLIRAEIIQQFARIYTKHSLPQDQKKQIKNVLGIPEIQFTVEEQ